MLRKDLLERGREKERKGEKKQGNNSTEGCNNSGREVDAGGQVEAEPGFLSMRTRSSSKKQGEAWGEVMKEVASPHPPIS